MSPRLPSMPDTNVYILRLQGKLPEGVLAFVEGRAVLHCGLNPLAFRFADALQRRRS